MITAVLGAVASVALWAMAAQQPPVTIILLFIVWVSAPFIAFIAGNRLSTRWPLVTRKTLYLSTLVVTVAAITVYLKDVIWPPIATRAFVWVVVPPVMGTAVVVAVGISWLVSGRRESTSPRP